MRSGLLFLSLVAAVGLAGSRAAVKQTAEMWWRNALYRRDLRFEGLKMLSPQQLTQWLPHHKSTWWWYWRRGALSGGLMTHPLVRRAEVEPCAEFNWGCFNVRVRERRAAAWVVLEGEPWLAGSDGSLIAPVSDPQRLIEIFGDQTAALERLPLIEGLAAGAGMAPQIVAARLKHAIAAARLIAAESGYAIERMQLAGNGEVEVRFHGVPAAAKFDVIKGRAARLRKEARRFRRVLEEFRGREDVVRAVDLAYDKMAVVKLAE